MTNDIVSILTSWVALRYVTATGEEVQGMRPTDLNRSLLDRGHKDAKKLTADDYRRMGFRVVYARLTGKFTSPLMPCVVLL
jgi:hypothetical protein